MTEKEKYNWQIRINVFGTTEEVYAVHDQIANVMGRERYNDIRLINVDRGEDEIYDDTLIGCKACGRLSDNLFEHLCDACLSEEKALRQAEEDAKYDDDKRGTEWDWVSFCPDCNTPTNYNSDDCFWYCVNNDCDNNVQDVTVNAYKFDARRYTVAELAELKKKYSYTEWI